MLKIPIKSFPVTGIIILFAIIAFFLVKADYRKIEDLVLQHTASEEGFELKNIHYIQDDPDESVKWVLDADKVTFTKDRQALFFDQFRFKLELKNDSTIELKGDSGEYNKDSSEITLRGDLSGNTSNGYALSGHHIIYKQKEGSLESDKPVKLTGPFFSVEGKGLQYDLERETLKIGPDVTTFIHRGSLI